MCDLLITENSTNAINSKFCYFKFFIFKIFRRTLEDDLTLKIWKGNKIVIEEPCKRKQLKYSFCIKYRESHMAPSAFFGSTLLDDTVRKLEKIVCI